MYIASGAGNDEWSVKHTKRLEPGKPGLVYKSGRKDLAHPMSLREYQRVRISPRGAFCSPTHPQVLSAVCNIFT